MTNDIGYSPVIIAVEVHDHAELSVQHDAQRDSNLITLGMDVMINISNDKLRILNSEIQQHLNRLEK